MLGCGVDIALPTSALTGDRTAECCTQPFCTAVVADAPLALLLGQHELVDIVLVVGGLMVEQTVPGDVM